MGKLDKPERRPSASFASRSSSSRPRAPRARSTRFSRKAHLCRETHILSSICAPDAEGVKRLRDLADKLKQKAPNAVAVLGMKDPADESKVSLLVAVGPQAPKSLNANDILKELAPAHRRPRRRKAGSRAGRRHESRGPERRDRTLA